MPNCRVEPPPHSTGNQLFVVQQIFKSRNSSVHTNDNQHCNGIHMLGIIEVVSFILVVCDIVKQIGANRVNIDIYYLDKGMQNQLFLFFLFLIVLCSLLVVISLYCMPNFDGYPANLLHKTKLEETKKICCLEQESRSV